MTIQILDRYIKKRRIIGFGKMSRLLREIQTDMIKTTIVNLLTFYQNGSENRQIHLTYNCLRYDDKSYYKACKDLVKEDKLVEFKHWYSFNHKFRLKNNQDIRKEKLNKIKETTN